MLLHANLDSLAARTEDLSRRFFSMILWILPPVFTASFLHSDPPLSLQGSDLLKSFLKSILVPCAIVLLYSMVLTTTSKPTFLPLSLFYYLIICLITKATLCVHIFMYVCLFVHSADWFFNVFKNVFMFYVGLVIVRSCSVNDIVLFID